MRLIDADALTEKCGDWYVEEGTEEGFIGTLGQLLSVQPEINCSEIPNNSDTISRQAAIDAICEHGTDLERRGITVLAVVNHKQATVDLLENLPSAQPERKTGRWIYGESEVGNDGYYCSECGNFVPWIYEESAMNFIREYKFCPNCGAKMESGEADE